ncbi:MAG TPA: SMI1/KNR4 family protein [Kofleriaceae bacterium]|nr:SMI1/KNR4 family protein [Kofleriaceae bacterium]
MLKANRAAAKKKAAAKNKNAAKGKAAAKKTPLDAALSAALRRVSARNEDPRAAGAALAELPVKAPPALRTAYAVLAGTTIEPDDGPEIDVFDLHELADVHRQTGYRETLPGALFFASDGGSGWYFVDTDGEVGGERGAVLWADRSAASRGNCRRVADDVAGFLRAAARGKLHPHVAAASIDDEEAGDLAELLDATREAWVSGGIGKDFVELMTSGVSRRLGCNVTGELGQLYEITDGLTVRRAKAEIWPAGRIERADAKDGLPEHPFENNLFPTGFWIGEHQGSRLLYCIGLTTWRGLADGMVVAVAQGQPPDAGVVLGRLTTLVRRWLS